VIRISSSSDTLLEIIFYSANNLQNKRKEKKEKTKKDKNRKNEKRV
jgi:hypothetical protein